MTNLEQLITKHKQLSVEYFDLIHEVRFLTENIYCLTILGDNTHPDYGNMTIAEQAEKLSKLTSQLVPLVKENLEINQAILKELIKETHEPTILQFLKILLDVSDRTLELNDTINILLSINVHKLNVGNSRKTGFTLYFSHYNE